MNCWACGTELIWGGDLDTDNYNYSGYQIVTNLSCPECKALVFVYHGEAED